VKIQQKKRGNGKRSQTDEKKGKVEVEFGQSFSSAHARKQTIQYCPRMKEKFSFQVTSKVLDSFVAFCLQMAATKRASVDSNGTFCEKPRNKCVKPSLPDNPPPPPPPPPPSAPAAGG